MADFYGDLASLLTYDPGHRGLAGRVPPTDLLALARSLTSGKRFMIMTGFPIPSCGVCETDGPPGAAVLARALIRAKKHVIIVTDEYNFKPVEAAGALFAPEAQVFAVPHDSAEEYCKALRRKEKPTHIIALERPGRRGGHYHNMRGEVIDQYVANTDCLFDGFSGVTVGIGDGGNELGMGAFADIIAESVANGDKIAADFGCNFPLVAGVSNWWGWGIAALLSAAYGEDFLPSDSAETTLLQAVVDAGAVDGITRKQELSVDGLTLEENLSVLRKIRALVLRQINK